MRSCEADAEVLNSRGYAHMRQGRGGSRPATHPGGVYNVPNSSTPSSRAYLIT